MWFDPAIWLTSLQLFFKSGGWVLLLLAAIALLMFSLLLERCWFRWYGFPKRQRSLQASFSPRELVIECGELMQALQLSMELIKTLIALCPLVGLLGTVTGMIQVFDILAFNGTGNPRLMSAGVAKATIPTMAGLVLAVFGLLLYSGLQRWSLLQLATIAQIQQGL